MALNKHQIFASNDLKEAFVEMPDWGGKVKIKALSVQEQLDYDAFLSSGPSEVEMAIHLIIIACVDDSGNKLFGKDDIEPLKKKKASNLFKLVKEIINLNNQDVDSVDNLAKNS